MSDSIQEPTENRTALSPTEAPLARRAARNALWVALGSYWVIGFGFVANILLIRLLTPQIYGEFALAMFFHTLFDLQSKISLSFAFAQRRQVNGETVGTVFAMSVLLGGATLLLALLAAPILLAAGYSDAVVMTSIFLSALSFIGSWLMAFVIILETELNYRPIGIATIIGTPLSYVPAFWLAHQGLGQYSLVSQTMVYGLSVVSAVLFYVLHARRDLLRMRWRFRASLAVEYLRFGLTSGLSNFISSMLVNVDNFILGSIAGTAVLGYYDRAYRVAQWPSLLLNAVVGRAAVFTYSQVRDSEARLQRSMTMTLWISANIAMPLALALFLSAPELVPLVFGSQWTPAIPLLRILLIGAMLRPLWENGWAGLVGIGLPQRALAISLIQLAVLIVLAVGLTPILSAIGTAIASVLMFAVGLGFTYSLLRRHLSLDLLGSLSGPLTALALTGGGYWLLVRLIGPIEPAWLALVWKVGWAFGGFVLFSLLIQPKQFTGRVTYIWQLLRRGS